MGSSPAIAAPENRRANGHAPLCQPSRTRGCRGGVRPAPSQRGDGEPSPCTVLVIDGLGSGDPILLYPGDHSDFLSLDRAIIIGYSGRVDRGLGQFLSMKTNEPALQSTTRYPSLFKDANRWAPLPGRGGAGLVGQCSFGAPEPRRESARASKNERTIQECL